MITFKIESWYMTHAQNRHLIVFWKGERIAKFYTHRYLACGNARKTIGYKFAIDVFAGGRRRRRSVTVRGDSEYLLSPANRTWRKFIRVA